jgi:hypothetical protein
MQEPASSLRLDPRAAATVLLVPSHVDRLDEARRAAAQCLGQDASAASKAARGLHPDVIELLPAEKKDHIGVDQVREAIRSAHFSPTEAMHKLCLIPRAEALTPEAAHALLKTLEEPPPGVRFLLLVSNPTELLPTILSRSQIVRSTLRPAVDRFDRFTSAGYSELEATWLATFPLHPEDESRITASRPPLASSLGRAAEALLLADVPTLVDACLGEDPLARRQALLLFLQRALSGDPDVLTLGVRALAQNDRETVALFLCDLLKVAFYTSRLDRTASNTPPDDLADRVSHEVGTSRLRTLCLAVDHAHRGLAVYGSAEAILLSLFVPCEEREP